MASHGCFWPHCGSGRGTDSESYKRFPKGIVSNEWRRRGTHREPTAHFSYLHSPDTSTAGSSRPLGCLNPLQGFGSPAVEGAEAASAFPCQREVLRPRPPQLLWLFS